jgi:hypothetical protein
MGVITSPDQVTTENAAQYEAEYVTDDNIQEYERNNDPGEFDEF